MMRYWNALSDESQDFLMIAALFVEAFLLFGVMV